MKSISIERNNEITDASPSWRKNVPTLQRTDVTTYRRDVWMWACLPRVMWRTALSTYYTPTHKPPPEASRLAHNFNINIFPWRFSRELPIWNARLTGLWNWGFVAFCFSLKSEAELWNINFLWSMDIFREKAQEKYASLVKAKIMPREKTFICLLLLVQKPFIVSWGRVLKARIQIVLRIYRLNINTQYSFP